MKHRVVSVCIHSVSGLCWHLIYRGGREKPQKNSNRYQLSPLSNITVIPLFLIISSCLITRYVDYNQVTK